MYGIYYTYREVSTTKGNGLTERCISVCKNSHGGHCNNDTDQLTMFVRYSKLGS